MQFYPCVVFLKETDVDNAVEFKDGQWHFYAAGDIGNSKKNTVAQGMDPENHKEFIVEVSNKYMILSAVSYLMTYQMKNGVEILHSK